MAAETSRQITTGLVTSGHKRIDEEVSVSPHATDVLNELHKLVLETLSDAVKAVTSQDSDPGRYDRSARSEPENTPQVACR